MVQCFFTFCRALNDNRNFAYVAAAKFVAKIYTVDWKLILLWWLHVNKNSWGANFALCWNQFDVRVFIQGLKLIPWDLYSNCIFLIHFRNSISILDNWKYSLALSYLDEVCAYACMHVLYISFVHRHIQDLFITADEEFVTSD